MYRGITECVCGITPLRPPPHPASLWASSDVFSINIYSYCLRRSSTTTTKRLLHFVTHETLNFCLSEVAVRKQEKFTFGTGCDLTYFTLLVPVSLQIIVHVTGRFYLSFRRLPPPTRALKANIAVKENGACRSTEICLHRNEWYSSNCGSAGGLPSPTVLVSVLFC